MDGELAARLLVTLAFLGSFGGLMSSLSIDPIPLWTTAVIITSIPTIWLWRRWLDRLELERDIARSRPEPPKPVQDHKTDPPTKRLY